MPSLYDEVSHSALSWATLVITLLDPWYKKRDIEAAWEMHERHAKKASDAMLIADRRRNWVRRHMANQGGKCHYCQISMYIKRDEPIPGYGFATCDHVIALANGGEDSFENTVAACDNCNQLKATGTIEELFSHPAFRRRLTHVERETANARA
jgi:5-methylcytosine-specific restriction endonuclease McrA